VTARSGDKKLHDNIIDLEKGTRFMEAEPALKPAFNQVKTQMHNDINRLMK